LLFRKRRGILAKKIANYNQKKYGLEPEKNGVDAILYFPDPKKISGPPDKLDSRVQIDWASACTVDDYII
jgi:hypothetical protein